MSRHSKGEFHVSVKELKLFDHKFFFRHIATRHFDFSQRCFTVFVLFQNLLHSACIQQFRWLMILSNNLFHFSVELFSTPKRKKNSSTRKRNYCFQQVRLRKVKSFPFRGKISEVNPGLYCSKRKNRQFVRIDLLVGNLINGKLYRPNVCHHGFKIQSLT